MFEVGKYYKTVGGQKALVEYISEFSVFHPIRGVVFDDEEKIWRNIDWASDGHIYLKGELHKNDLTTEEWKERKRVRGWINIYSHDCVVFTYDTKKEADKYAMKGRIACVYIDVEEGEGL